MSLIKEINKEKLPTHIAIIMDGNGRWAKQRDKDRSYGHEKGVNSVKEVIEGAGEIGIKFVTLYTFSTENWNRPKEEVDLIMNLLVNTIHSQIDSLNKNNVRLKTIGNIESLSSDCYCVLSEALTQTENNTGLTLVLALNYSSRNEITNAIKNIAIKAKNGLIKSEDIDETTISSFLNTSFMPDPDLLIRTSGELRLSNYLLWQLAYTELYFTSVLWPDFTRENLYEAIIEYQKRERRFGKISDQINSSQ